MTLLKRDVRALSAQYRCEPPVRVAAKPHSGQNLTAGITSLLLCPLYGYAMVSMGRTGFKSKTSRPLAVAVT